MVDTVNGVVRKPFFSRVRRNHGLEHATISVLSKRHPGIRLGGHSDGGGFWILGEVSTEDLTAAVNEALSRLRAGEEHLAVHPNCGTNFVTSGVFAGLAGALAMLGVGPRKRDKLERLPLAAVFATMALILSQPLGLLFQQRVTTSGVPEGLQVVSITRKKRGGMTAHRISTRG